MNGMQCLYALITLFGIITLLLLNYWIPPTPRPRPLASLGILRNNNTRFFIPEPSAVCLQDIWNIGHDRPHPELCPDKGARLRLLIFVTLAPGHAAARDAVRYTWGQRQRRSDVSLVFMLGKSPQRYEAALEHEDAIHGDLVSGRNPDLFSNIPLKTLSMLEWTDTYCPYVSFLLRTNDEAFINMERLLRFVTDAAQANATRTIWGSKLHRERPERTSLSKYYISKMQFPGEVFPDFLTGPAYLLTADCVKPLLDAAAVPGMRYIHLEDVFVTGLLALRAGLTRIHAPEFHNSVSLNPCLIRKHIVVHAIRYYEQFDLWRRLFDNRTDCNLESE